MAQREKTYSKFAQTITNDLLDAVKSGEDIDPELISYAEDVIKIHQLIVQLSFVGLIIDRLPQLANYNDALEDLLYQLEADFAEADIPDKIRAAQMLNQSVKTTVDIINDMMASKDAVSMLIASLKDNFGEGSSGQLVDEDGDDKNLMNKFSSLPADKRQQLLAGFVTLLRQKMPEGVEEANDDG